MEGTVNKPKTRRLGRFIISEAVVEDLIARGNEARLVKLTSNIFITRSEFKWENRTFHYVGISPDFEEVREGEEIPLYQGTWDDKQQKVIWTRQE